MRYVIVFILVLPALFFAVAKEGVALSLSAQPTQFFRTEVGDFYGFTVTGAYFQQQRILIDPDIRLQHFSLGSIAYYVSDRGIIYAATDTEAMSIYLARA